MSRASSGAIAPNEPSYWQVDPDASSDKWLVVMGYGANGYHAQDLRCNFRIDIEGVFDPDEIRAGADYDSVISNWQYVNGHNYFIAGDSVYWMNKHAKGSDPSDYEWVVQKAKGGDGVVSADNRYAMISNNNQSAVYLIGVIGDYTVDVKANQWYTDAVLWANENGIACGYGNGVFGPMDTLTREQFAAMLQRYAKYKGLDVAKSADLAGYTDAERISAWAVDAMQWANAEGLILGRTKTTLVPQGDATRAETAAILMRFMET